MRSEEEIRNEIERLEAKRIKSLSRMDLRKYYYYLACIDALKWVLGEREL